MKFEIYWSVKELFTSKYMIICNNIVCTYIREPNIEDDIIIDLEMGMNNVSNG